MWMAWQKFDTTYKPGQKEAFKVSRSKIDQFLNCPRCFWLDRRLGIKQPSMPPFNINLAIDELLKKEFDTFRKAQKSHPYMTAIGLDAVPFEHPKLADWRHTFTGVEALHAPTNLMVFGAVDDLWVTTGGEVIVVDYKATAKDTPITGLGPVGGWQDTYRRQMEVYQWLLRANGLQVSDTSYFVYANGRASEKSFDEKVLFDVATFPYTGSDAWVEKTLIELKSCLDADIPSVGNGAMGNGCEHCAYARSRTELTLRALQKNK